MRGEDLSAFVPPDDATPREGAVLVLFGDGPDGPDLLLTERGHDMRSQPGHVAFPGGSLDEGESAGEGALREAHEETGLDPAGVDVIAVLPRIWLPPRNFAVATVLAYWRSPTPVGVVDTLEVHAVFRESVLPALHEQFGYEGSYVLLSPDGKALVVTFWASEDDADAGLVGARSFYAEQVAKFATIYRSPPGRDSYDVVLAEVPTVTVG